MRACSVDGGVRIATVASRVCRNSHLGWRWRGESSIGGGFWFRWTYRHRGQFLDRRFGCENRTQYGSRSQNSDQGITEPPTPDPDSAIQATHRQPAPATPAAPHDQQLPPEEPHPSAIMEGAVTEDEPLTMPDIARAAGISLAAVSNPRRRYDSRSRTRTVTAVRREAERLHCAAKPGGATLLDVAGGAGNAALSGSVRFGDLG
jgi:hypothetical protein